MTEDSKVEGNAKYVLYLALNPSISLAYEQGWYHIGFNVELKIFPFPK